MNDRAVGVLEQYEVEVQRTRKGRGALLCDTRQGCYILKEYKGNPEKCRLQDRLLKQVAGQGEVRVEQILPTKEGELLSKDADGTSYLLKTYFEGRECNIRDRSECIEAAKELAKLHRGMAMEEDGLPEVFFSPGKEYEKHNRELRKVRRYLRQKGQKTWFEISLLNSMDPYLEQAEAVMRDWGAYSGLSERQPECRSFCHGDYQYHNILRVGGEWHIVNFEKCMRDNPVRDLYLLLRKLLEKSDWDVGLGSALLDAYDSVRPISAYSWIDLHYRLAYPEKFWKIVNFYYNSGKAWIPEKNREKLQKLLDQEEAKRRFLEEVFESL